MAFLGTTHIDRALTEVSVLYMNDDVNFVSDKIAPLVPVQKESDSYFVYGRDHFRQEDLFRANGSESKEVDHWFSTASYIVNEYAAKMFVSDRSRDNADAPLALDVDAAKLLTHQLLISRELEVASLLMATASFSNNLSAAAAGQWSLDSTTSDPLLIANTALATTLLQSGSRPNKVVMGHGPFLSLKRHQLVSDRIKYTERSIVTESLIASLFEVDSVLVGRAVFNNAIEEVGGGSDPESMTTIWGNNALWLFVPPSPSLRSPATAYMISKSDGGMQIKMKKWREEKLAGDYIEGSFMMDPRIVASLTGFFASGVSA